jgi:uncharacterized protein with LGFP repeats
MSAIDAKYAEVIGANPWLGTPTTPENTCPDRVGRHRHYQNGGSIYWTPQTGAHLIYGLIRAKWERLGWERGPNGYPTTDEADAGSGRGRYNNFTNGTIIWRRGAGEAFSVYGAIYSKWGETGWDRGFLGFPVTDESGTPDGVGHFNHFEGGSIYWTPATGAHIVLGAIRDHWARDGWERGALGYPTTDELVTPGTNGAGRHSVFQGGTIFWTPSTGTRVQLNGGASVTAWVDWLRCHSETPGFGIGEGDEPFAVVATLDFAARAANRGVTPTRTVLYGPLDDVDDKENHSFPYAPFYQGSMQPEVPTFLVALLENDNVSADITRTAGAAAVQAAAVATALAPRDRVVEESLSAFAGAVEPVSGPAVVNRLIGRPVAVTPTGDEIARARRGEKVDIVRRFSSYGDYSLQISLQAR